MGQVSLIAIVTNVLVLPVVAPAMCATFVAGLLALGSTWLALPAAYIAYMLLSYIVQCARMLAALPLAAITVPYVPLPAFIYFLYGGMVMGVWWVGKRSTTQEPLLKGWIVKMKKI